MLGLFLGFYISEDPYPQYQFKIPEEIDSQRIVDIDAIYNQYKVPDHIALALNKLIDKETHEKLFAPELDAKFFERKGFTIFSGFSNSSSTLVLGHPNYCRDYLIKVNRKVSRKFLYMEGPFKTLGSIRTISHTNLLRPLGSKAIKKNMGQTRDFVFTNEFLYQSPHASEQRPLNQRYYAISQKKHLLSPKQTRQQLQSQQRSNQIKLAHRIIDFIKRTGMVDFHSGNLVLDNESEDVIFVPPDTEPLGMFVKEAKEAPQGLIPHHYRVAVGLLNFRELYCRKLPIYKKEAEKALRAYLQEHPEIQVKAKLSSSATWILVAKIVLSIILPIIPLVVLIWAFIKQICCSFDDIISSSQRVPSLAPV